MTTEHELVEMIHVAKLKIVETNLCDHPKEYCYYFTEELVCDENVYLDDLDFSWKCRRGCKECFDGSIGILDCGGHYETLIAFHNGIINTLNKIHTKKLGAPANTQMNLRLILDKVNIENLKKFRDKTSITGINSGRL